MSTNFEFKNRQTLLKINTDIYFDNQAIYWVKHSHYLHCLRYISPFVGNIRLAWIFFFKWLHTRRSGQLAEKLTCPKPQPQPWVILCLGWLLASWLFCKLTFWRFTISPSIVISALSHFGSASVTKKIRFIILTTPGKVANPISEPFHVSSYEAARTGGKVIII
jgi:hypothetical protein